MRGGVQVCGCVGVGTCSFLFSRQDIRVWGFTTKDTKDTKSTKVIFGF